MKWKIAGSAVLVVLATGCASWPAKRFEQITGIPLSKEHSLCRTISTKDAMRGCEPAVGGLAWQKVTDVQTLPLPSAQSYEDKAQTIASQYLGHRYGKGSVLVGCPAINPYTAADASAYAEYFRLEKTKSTLASVFMKTAVQQAKLNLKAAAKAKQQPAISGQGMAAFESALESRIAATTSQGTDIIYVQGYLTSGLQEVPVLFAPYKACLEGLDLANESIVTGIAGFYLADFKSSTKVFSEEMMSTAIDAAAAVSPADSAVLEAVKVEASGQWTMAVNTRLEQIMTGKKFDQTFFPLYIRFERPG